MGLKFNPFTGTLDIKGSSGGSGDVAGPASSTDNAIARFDSTTGKLIQNSGPTIDDAGILTIPKNSADSTAIILKGNHAGGRMGLHWIDDNNATLAVASAHNGSDPTSTATHWHIYTPNAAGTLLSRFIISALDDDPTILMGATMKVAVTQFTTAKPLVELVSNTDNAVLLKFGMDRIWQFEQDGTGASTALVLRTTSATKNFNLQDESSNTFVRFASAGHILNTGYLHVGSMVAPTNTTAGDLTAQRGFFNGLSTALANKTAAYTITASDSIITADATSAAFTITLPTAVGITGRQYTIKKTDSTGNVVTVDGNGSETIDGAATYPLALQYKYVNLVSNGTNWLVVGNN